MSYRIEKDETGEQLILDGFEKGIAASPYAGIGNIRNLNTTYYPGVAYTNYKRQAATLSGAFFYAGSHSVNVSNNSGWIFADSGSGSIGNPIAKATSPAGLNYILDNTGQVWKQSAVNSSIFNELSSGTGRLAHGNKGLAYWDNYLVVFGDGFIEFCGLGTSDSDIISSNWNVQNNNSVHFAATISPSQLLYAGPGGEVYLNANDPVTFTTTGTLPAPLALATTYYVVANTDPIIGTVFQVSATPGGSAIVFTTIGTGVHTITNNRVVVPISNIASINITTTFSLSDTTFTIISYTTPTGTTATGNWQGATGQYNITDPNGNKLLATFTNGSPTITLLSPLVMVPAGTYSVEILDETATVHKTLVSKVDGNLYFGNGRNLGRILSQNANISFIPNYPTSYVVDYGVTELLQPDDDVVDMVDLKSTMVICGNKDTYTWDYVSSNVSAPSPVGEQIVRVENLLSNLYITAGQKGNIYLSNGYSNQILLKIPDFIAGVIDPVWSFGDLMIHRAKLWFQALAYSTSGTNLLAGIFSLNVSPTKTDIDMSDALVMEAQNSYGLTPPLGALQNGLLISNEPSSSGQDSYYSVWSNGATTGGIDYNDTTLWQNFEPIIETDIVPIGNILDKKTFGNIEFKLDRPMTTGDQIRLSWRPSITDSYTVMGTTTSLQLSDYYPSNISQSQWAQFKVEFACASSGSSFIPLREIRLHFN